VHASRDREDIKATFCHDVTLPVFWSEEKMTEPRLDMIRERFSKVAFSPDQENKFPVGASSAKVLGYDPGEIDDLATSVTESFCGVGNPLSLGELAAGETVLDLGSGAGLDSILASRRVGPSGRVLGIDMTQEMIDKAKANVHSLGLANVDFQFGDIEALPFDDSDVHVVITNGVFNLCLSKAEVLSEVFRVLRPGGRIQMADILLHDDVTPEELATKGTWSD
jgi:SAM-dependent methyltransferase